MSLCHPFHRIAQIVAEASKEDPERVAWSENLLVRDRTSVTAEEVADTWIAVTFDYAVARTAGARAGIQTEMPDVPSARKPRAARFLDHAEADLVEKVRQAQLRGDPDAGTQWLKLLATLPKPSQAAIVNSAAKQIHWHLLPSALALRSDRVVALSLSDTVAPRWHSPPEDPEEQTKLMWLFSHEGIRPGHAAVTVLESDEYARGRAEVSAGGAEWRSRLSSAARWLELPGDDHGGVAVVQNRGELLETLYETAFAGYVEPVVAAYAERLAEHGIRVDSKRFYASGIVALVHPARHQYDLATVALREVGARVDQDRTAGQRESVTRCA